MTDDDNIENGAGAANVGSGEGGNKNVVEEIVFDTVGIDHHNDPFAKREGKLLVWKDVNMTLAGKTSGEPARKLIDNVWGQVPPRETTAL